MCKYVLFDCCCLAAGGAGGGAAAATRPPKHRAVYFVRFEEYKKQQLDDTVHGTGRRGSGGARGRLLVCVYVCWVSRRHLCALRFIMRASARCLLCLCAVHKHTGARSFCTFSAGQRDTRANIEELINS